MLPKTLLYTNLPDDLHARLKQHTDLTQVESLTSTSRSDLQSLLLEAEGLIGVGETVGPELLELAPNLKVASTISVGYDYFDVPALTERGVMLMHTPDVLTETTADMVFALILGAGRRVTEMSELVRQGKWTENIGSEYFGTDIYGKKLGILGMGRIGQAVARRAYAGFNMEVSYFSRSVKEQAEKEFKAKRSSLDQILAESDFVCVILPLSDETNKLIGPRELSLMKPGAFLINGGRGPVVDETALIEALQNRSILGAGLDVYEQEPLPSGSPLLNLPNVVLLPHIGSATHETRYAMAQCAVENILGALTSRSSVNCVNPEVI